MNKKPGVTSAENRAGRAKIVLERWEESRLPFILYLRKFRVPLYHGQGFLLENQLWALHDLTVHKVGVLTVVDQNETPLPGSRGHAAPALVLSNKEWQPVVSDLIAKASMIISEVPLLGPGAAFELETCVQKHKVAQTVIILPPPNVPFELLDDNPITKSFPRVIWSDEIPELSAAELFVFRDLLDRAKEIARLEAQERRTLTDEGRLEGRFPIAFGGLVTGYTSFATAYTADGQLARAARSYFRALVATVAGNDKRKMADIAEDMVKLFLRMDDRVKASNYLNGAMKFAHELGDDERITRLKDLATTLDHVG